MIRGCAADDCCNLVAVTGHGSRNRKWCSGRCKCRINQRLARTGSPSLRYRGVRVLIVAAVADRLAAANNYEALAALRRFSEFELDLLASMEAAA